MGQSSLLNSSIVVMGRIGAPFGIKGGVHVYSFAESPDALLDYGIWYLRFEGQPWQKVQVLEAKKHGKSYSAILQGYETREDVARLTNAEIGVEREALPVLGPGEYYWTDLIGLKVITTSGEILGIVEGLLETGSNDVLVVKGDTREHLIPYIPEESVLEINLESRMIRVSWDPEF